jgi:hypothetical protein
MAQLVASGLATCARCGLRIAAGAEFDLVHTDDRAGYLGASHQACNSWGTFERSAAPGAAAMVISAGRVS